MPLDEYKEILLDEYDVDFLVELLQIEPEELLDRFEDKVIAYREAQERSGDEDADV